MESLVVRTTNERLALVAAKEVQDALTDIEMSILKAASGKQLSQYGNSDLIREGLETFVNVAGDVGYNINNERAFVSNAARLCSILKSYYPDYTLDDVSKAFELLEVGMLDGYLPKDSFGYPDRKHYQQFNIGYLCKVMNAYKNIRQRVIRKAQQAAPSAGPQVDEQERMRLEDEFKAGIVRSFLKYKYTGVLDCGTNIGEMLTYNYLAECGLVDEMEVTMDEQVKLIDSIVNAIAKKTVGVNDYIKIRRERLKAAFDEMIAEELQITDYLCAR